MSKVFHPLLALIASSTDRELAKYVQYLKEENKILRARVPGQIHTRPAERERLLKFGRAIGRAIEELMTIVTPGTFYRWLREEDGKPKAKNPKGGQRKPKEIRELVIQIAKTTGFGYTRIIGELQKLGIKKISRQTVRNILKEEGIQPGPNRSSDTWNEFIQRHRETPWACDFFSVKTVTKRGLRDMYVLVFLCLETREVIVSPATEHPNSAWVVRQAETFVDQTANRETKPDIIMHDRDAKFTKEFTAKLRDHGLRTNVLPKASRNLNGRCERFIGRSAFVSFARGLNDTPKIAALLLVAPQFGGFTALALIGALIAVGGLISARRVAETMSNRITTMNHGQGFTANLITGLVVLGASRFGVPVSTTHVSCGSLFGIGVVSGEAERSTIGRILASWITTLPLAAALSAVVSLLMAL